MNKTLFSTMRVLVVGSKSHPMMLLRSVMHITGITQVIHIEDSRRAIELLSMDVFSAVFFEDGVADYDGMPFAIAARRKESMVNPMLPIFLLQERARRRDVEKARDVGATDVLTVPMSPATLMTKLRTAVQAPRPFIVAPEFFGPDRRGARGAFHGQERRVRQPRKTKVDFTHI